MPSTPRKDAAPYARMKYGLARPCVVDQTLDFEAVWPRLGRMRTLLGFVRALVVTVAVAVPLSGCGGVLDPGFANELMPWQDSPYADLALGAISRSDYPSAEKYAEKALRQNHRDAYGLYALALVYENTGRPEKARQAYKETLMLRPDGPATVAGPGQLTNLQLNELATAHLRALEEGGGLRSAGPGMTVTAMPQPIGGRQPPATSARSAVPLSPGPAPTVAPPASTGDGTAVRRFEILRQLVTQGLATEDEYKVRRNQNLGVLLPLSSPPPGSGLDRPVPSHEEISARLQALRTAFEMRSISAGEHAAERTMILEGLLPAQPSMMAPPSPPPTGIIETAAMAGRLERLRAAALITSEEVAKEREHLDRILRGPVPLAGPPADQRLLVPPPADKGSGKVSLHLASYKSRSLADEGWEQIKGKFSDVLAGIPYKIATVDLGKKGKSYRLKAGPMARSAGEEICRKLSARHQYCKPEAN